MQLVYLIGDKQFIAVDDITLSHYFILLEVSLGQCPIYVVYVVLSLKVSILHETILTNGRTTAIFIVFFNQVRLEKKVPSVDLITFPLCEYQMAVIIDCYTKTFKQRL